MSTLTSVKTSDSPAETQSGTLVSSSFGRHKKTLFENSGYRCVFMARNKHGQLVWKTQAPGVGKKGKQKTFNWHCGIYKSLDSEDTAMEAARKDAVRWRKFAEITFVIEQVRFSVSTNTNSNANKLSGDSIVTQDLKISENIFSTLLEAKPDDIPDFETCEAKRLGEFVRKYLIDGGTSEDEVKSITKSYTDTWKDYRMNKSLDPSYDIYEAYTREKYVKRSIQSSKTLKLNRLNMQKSLPAWTKSKWRFEFKKIISVSTKRKKSNSIAWEVLCKKMAAFRKKEEKGGQLRPLKKVEKDMPIDFVLSKIPDEWTTEDNEFVIIPDAEIY